MCFDHQGYAEFGESKVVKCRKPHKCYECSQAISAGELADYQTGKYDGGFYAYYICGACECTRGRIADQEIAAGCRGSEIWCPYGMLQDYCYETKFEMSSHAEGQAYLAKLREPVKV